MFEKTLTAPEVPEAVLVEENGMDTERSGALKSSLIITLIVMIGVVVTIEDLSSPDWFLLLEPL